MTTATEAQINYINDLVNGLIEELNKGPQQGNFYLRHFGKTKRDYIRQSTKDLDREEAKTIKSEIEANKEVAYWNWVELVKQNIEIDPNGMTKSEASEAIDYLKTSRMFNVEYPV